MRRLLIVCSLVLASTGLTAPSAFAQQSVSFYLGGFVPRGEDSRAAGDVIFNDQDFFTFDMGDFTGATFGGEWLIALNPRIEVGLGLGLYSQTVDSYYSDLINEDGSNIEQRLKLRTVPFTASFRVLPFGRSAPVQPYVGAGVAVTSWTYTETGDFIDFDGFIFHDRFEASGTAAGPLILGGVRIPMGDAFDIGFEVRHQSGEGDVDPVDFAGATKIDLGGFSYLATFNIRF